MAIPAWSIATWDEVDTSVETWEESLGQFRHVETSVDPVPDKDGFHHGQTLWACGMGEPQAVPLGIAWDWREIRHGIVIIADPMGVVSNVRLRRGDNPIDEGERLLCLNNAIFSLPWQRVARKASRADWSVLAGPPALAARVA